MAFQDWQRDKLGHRLNGTSDRHRGTTRHIIYGTFWQNCTSLLLGTITPPRSNYFTDRTTSLRRLSPRIIHENCSNTWNIVPKLCICTISHGISDCWDKVSVQNQKHSALEFSDLLYIVLYRIKTLGKQ